MLYRFDINLLGQESNLYNIEICEHLHFIHFELINFNNLCQLFYAREHLQKKCEETDMRCFLLHSFRFCRVLTLAICIVQENGNLTHEKI